MTAYPGLIQALRCSPVRSKNPKSATGNLLEALEEEMRRTLREADELTAKADELMALAEAKRTKATRLDAVRTELGASDDKAFEPALPARAPSRPTRRTPPKARNRADDRTMTARVIEVINSKPDGTWTSTALQQRFPGTDKHTLGQILRKLRDRGLVVRLDDGKPRAGAYRLATGTSGVRRDVVSVLQQDQRAWRPRDLAKTLRTTSRAIDQTLKALVKDGTVVATRNGWYVAARQIPADDGRTT
ncbi:hypothetical protein [Actinosynnema sp. NPDC020468]|uniref:hypothetical protein n=1 Tax=Actinosynnema sp. NPDC020468 TaxID=3154488 RepID=UPI0033C58A69